MPYTLFVPTPWERPLDEMAALLLAPRELCVAVSDRHGGQPRPSSLGAADMIDDSVPEHLRQKPMWNAAVYLRVSSDHLASVSALFRARELLFSPASTCRVSFEHVVRAVLALDPDLTARARVARAVLDDVVSTYFARLAVKELGGKSTEPFRVADLRWKAAKMAAEEVPPCSWEGSGPRAWTVSGMSLLGFEPGGKAPTEWQRMRGDVPGAGYYAALSLYTHPQSQPEELHGADLSTDLSFVARCAMNALACWVDGARMLFCEYAGWDVPELDAFAARAASHLAELA